MKIKKTKYYNEKEEAERILSQGFSQAGYVDGSKMYLIARYLRHILGYGEKRLEKELIGMALEQDNNFNPVTQAGSIKKWIRSAMKSDSIPQTNEVKLYKEEIETLNNIDDIHTKKLLFTMLVSAKAKADLYKMGRLTVTYDELDSLITSIGMTEPQSIQKLHTCNHLLKPLTRYHRLVLLFGSTSGRTKERVNPNVMMDEFDRLFPNKTFTCGVCKKSFTYESKKKPKYCKDCAVGVDREKSKERWKKKTSI